MYRILIVDDEPMICKGLTITIEKAEHVKAVIHTAADGREALEAIPALQPHFVFTDIRMPRMDGLELCRQLFERHPDIQVVVVSGYGEFEYAQRCITYGVSDYLLKPITKRSVHRALDRLVEQYQARRKSAILSPARVEDWVEQLAEAVWSLREDELLLSLAQWEQELAGYDMNSGQQRALLSDCRAMLAKQLAHKGFEFTFSISESRSVQEGEPPFDHFRRSVLALLERLRAMRKGKSRDPIEEAKQYIEQHLAKEVSLEEVADMLGLNPSYFSQYFKQRTGETFVQYRIRRRMEKAKRLLELPHYRITDISYEIGYADHPHFTKTFKKAIGVSPSEYRKMMGIE